MKLRFKTQGFKELSQTLRGLSDDVRKRVLKRAARAGGLVVEEEAKRNAPVLKKADPRRIAGTLKKNIRTVSVKDKSIDGAAVKVHVRKLSRKAISAFKGKTGKSSAENPDDPFYARFVEYGTSKMSAQPFLRPALMTKRAEAVNAMRNEVKRGIDREARRRARKAKG